MYVGSFHDGSQSKTVSLRCFSKSLAGISGVAELNDFALHSGSTVGSGILIDLTDKHRWQFLTIWILKLIQKCLTEGTSYVQGLINMLFLNNVCILFHFGDADVHMVSHSYVLDSLLLFACIDTA